MREEPFATVLALDDLLVVTSQARGGLTQADMPIATTANINGSRSAVDVRFVDGKKGPGAVRRWENYRDHSSCPWSRPPDLPSLVDTGW